MMLGSILSPPSLAFECKRCFPVIGSVRPVGLVANWDCSRENAELCECLGMHARARVSSRGAGVRVGGQRVCVDSLD